MNNAIEMYFRTLGSCITYIFVLVGSSILSKGEEETPLRWGGKILALRDVLFKFSHVF